MRSLNLIVAAAALLAALLSLLAPTPLHADPPQAGAILTGRLLTPDGATGVSPYSLSLLSDKGRILATTYPDDQGHYRFSIAPGHYTLRAILDLPWITEQARPVTLQPGEQSLDLMLAQAPRITVDVRDELGHPIRDADVRTLLYIGADHATTDAEGRATLQLPVESAEALVRAPGYIPRTVTLVPDGRAGVTLLRGATITGRIDNPPPISTEQPLHATFTVPLRSRVAITSTIRPDGTFTIEGLDSGAGRLTLFAPGILATVLDGVLLERPLTTELPDVTPITGHSLTLRTIDTRGGPVPGTHVVLSCAATAEFQWSGDTDQQGAVTFRGLPPGRYSARVHDRAGWCSAFEPNLLFDIEELRAGAHLSIPILRTTTITGAFTWPDDANAPAKPTVVQINANSLTNPATETWIATLSTDEPGRFTINAVQPGRYRLAFQIDDDYWALLESIDIPEPETPAGMHDIGTVRLQPVNATEPPRG